MLSIASFNAQGFKFWWSSILVGTLHKWCVSFSIHHNRRPILCLCPFYGDVSFNGQVMVSARFLHCEITGFPSWLLQNLWGESLRLNILFLIRFSIAFSMQELFLDYCTYWDRNLKEGLEKFLIKGSAHSLSLFFKTIEYFLEKVGILGYCNGE